VAAFQELPCQYSLYLIACIQAACVVRLNLHVPPLTVFVELYKSCSFSLFKIIYFRLILNLYIYFHLLYSLNFRFPLPSSGRHPTLYAIKWPEHETCSAWCKHAQNFTPPPPPTCHYAVVPKQHRNKSTSL
jgi:hypothetical protein